MLGNSQKAVFLDRDGTINVEKQYLYRVEDFEYIDGVLEGLKRLSDAGFLLVLITNQSGIARGYYTEDDYLALDRWLRLDLGKKGISIAGSYYCPHLPEGKVGKYAKECDCRKPQTGLFWRAKHDLNIDMDCSYAVGDRERDLEICKESSVKGILFSQKNETTEFGVVCHNWQEIVECILESENSLKRALIYGAGNNFVYSSLFLTKQFNIVGVVDGSADKKGKVICGFTVGDVGSYVESDYDILIITPSYRSGIRQELLQKGVEETKIFNLEDALNQSEVMGKLRIAILFYGGLGDFIIGKNWLYHLYLQKGLDNAVIDVYFGENSRENAEAIFADCAIISAMRTIDMNSTTLIPECKYDLVLRFSIVPMIQYMNADRLFDLQEELFYYAVELKKFGRQNYNKGFFASPDFYKTVQRLFALFPRKKYHALYDVLEEIERPEEYICPFSIRMDEDGYLKELGLLDQKYITVNTGVNEEYTRKPSTRAWQYQNWLKLICILKEKLPEYKIVRMGLKSAEGDDSEADLDLSGKTNVEQAKVLLKNATIHIDYEGGLVHLRHVLQGGTSVVLFGSTSEQRYGYAENVAVRNDGCGNPCAWHSEDWATTCQREDASYICMKGITPKMVADVVHNYL